MPGRNLCIEAGCNPPSCCHDIPLHNLTEQDLTRFSANQIQYIPQLDTTKGGGKGSQRTLFFTERSPISDGQPYEGYLDGRCSCQSGTGNCTTHAQKPSPCRATKIGGKTCTEARRRDGRPPVLLKRR